MPLSGCFVFWTCPICCVSVLQGCSRSKSECPCAFVRGTRGGGVGPVQIWAAVGRWRHVTVGWVFGNWWTELCVVIVDDCFVFLQPYLMVVRQDSSCGGRSVGRPKRSFVALSVKEFAAVSVLLHWASAYYFVGSPPGNVPTPGAMGQSLVGSSTREVE